MAINLEEEQKKQEEEKLWSQYGKLQALRETLYAELKKTEANMRTVYQEIQKIKKEGVLQDYKFWSDNTGHVVFMLFFKDESKFAKLWGDQEFQSLASTSNRSYDNARIRVMRPANVT